MFGTWRKTSICCPHCLTPHLRYYKEGTYASQGVTYPVLWQCPVCSLGLSALDMRHAVTKGLRIESSNYPYPLLITSQGVTTI
jgi:hypothetical protein